MVSPVSGLFEVLAAAAVIAEPDADRSAMRHFEPEIVGLSTGPMQGSSGLPLIVDRMIDEVEVRTWW